MTDEILNIDITHEEKHHISHVVGESRPNVFSELWKDLEKHRNPNQQWIRAGLQSFSKNYNGVDANFFISRMELIIETIPFDALNDLLIFAGYNKISNNSLSYNQSGLNITIK